jgi:transcriptional regulator of acetoin/glycerol metabolism
MPDDTFRLVVAVGVALAALSMVITAVVAIVLFRAVSRLQVKVEDIVDQTAPVVSSMRHLLNENSHKVARIMTAGEETAANAREISVVAKDQVYRFAEVGRDITDRAKVQVARVDAVVDETVDQVQHLGANVRSAVRKPVSEVSGVLAGIRAGVAVYANGHRPNVARATQDEEMFI